MPNSSCRIAIIGAGPYGLSLAATLRSIGEKPRIFGEPMEFWLKRTPSGMLLRSAYFASSIGDPALHLELNDFAASLGKTFSERTRVEDFREYGLWYQQQAVPDVDRRKVTKLAGTGGAFQLTLEDGEGLEAACVVVAAGIEAFAHMPAQFAGISPRLASHASSHCDLSKFADARVIVVGSGQSAFESAALLLEHGAQVEIIMRAADVFWLRNSRNSNGKGSSRLRDLLNPRTDVGPLEWHFPPATLAVARPDFLRMLPRPIRQILHDASVRPAVSGWLRPRVAGATITASRRIMSADADSNRLTLTLDDRTRRTADHVLLGTGYRVDISRYSFIDPELLDSVARVDGYPELDRGFQSSVRGLYFTGAAAARSFGPLVRFVSGTKYSATTIARRIAADSNMETTAGRSAQELRNIPAPSPRGPASHKEGALVLGGDPASLGIIRSLGRHNIAVWALVGKYRLAGKSRYCGRTLRWPQPSDDANDLEFLLEVGRRYGLDGWLLLTTDDNRAAFLARNREALSERFLIPPPEWNVMRHAFDKRLTYQLAASLGLDHPMTYQPRTREEVAALEYEFPVVLKPAIKTSFNRFTRERAWLVNNREELLKRYEEAAGLVGEDAVLIQQMIPGGGENQLSYAALYDDGQPIASLVARRTRQFPIDFGQSSSYVETDECDGIERAAERLLGTLRYSGLVEVEFKFDPRDRTYKLLDINPRIWSWHTLAEKAGVDFPYLLWRLVHKQPLERIRGNPGVKWVRMVRDVAAASQELWRGRLTPEAYLRSVADASAFAVFSSDDLVPALLEIPLLFAYQCRTSLGGRLARPHLK
jgi:predicted ATP-grasp superfamily ATP-dependent carboligase/cation diffusion facilitator CzcD-associated flavoprotein CzcO